MNKKILYITTPFFLDYDLSFFKHLYETGGDITYLLDIQVEGKQTTLLNFNHDLKPGIYCFDDKKDLFPKYFPKYINFKKSFFIYRSRSKSYHWSNLKLIIWFLIFIKRKKFNFIHANNFLSFHLLLILLFRKIDLLTIHDPFEHSGEKNMKTSIIRKLNIQFAKKYLLLNKYQSTSFSELHKIDLNRIQTSHIGDYSVLKEFFMEKNAYPKSILFFGRISKYKGVDNLLKAIEKLSIARNDFKITVAGKGKILFDLDIFKNNKNVIIFNRYINPEELVSLIESHKVIILPYSDATQSGVLASCIPFNKPIICTKIPSLTEYIKEGWNGVFMKDNSVDSILKSLIFFIENESFFEQMTKNLLLESSSINYWKDHLNILETNYT